MFFAEDMGGLDEWLEKLLSAEDVYPKRSFPYEEWLEEYLNAVQDKEDKDVKKLLRILLSPYTLQMDVENYKNLKLIKRLQNEENLWDNCTSVDNGLDLEINNRIKNHQEAWEGLTWILQLLPQNPYKAIKAIGDYLDAELGVMHDDRIIGLNQCIDIIEKNTFIMVAQKKCC